MATKKQAQGLEDYLGTALRTLGSERGGALLGEHGGPVAGSLLQGALLGGLGYGGAKLLAPLYKDRFVPDKVAKTLGILGFLTPGLLHAPMLYKNLKAGLPLNTPPSGYTGQEQL